MTQTHTEILPSAAILGCAGTSLSIEERFFFERINPLGFILFARNCENPDQVRKLTAELRDCVGREDAPILIDQEGGRVQRLGPPHWPQRPPQNLFARIAEENRIEAREAASINASLIAYELLSLGIDVDCLPVLDVPVEGADDVIGDRAFGSDPEIVVELGQSVVAGLMACGVTPVIKHIPGHGRAMVDSHEALPRVNADWETLRKTDFLPFKAANLSPWAMTAHVVYEAIDATAPATMSPSVISEVIRGEIAYQGLLITDDLTMKALSGAPGDLAAQALEAGCDVVLHCNGDLEEMIDLMSGVPEMTGIAWERFQSGLAVRPAEELVDIAALEAQLADFIEAHA